MKILRVTKNVKKIKFKEVWGESKAIKTFQTQ